MNSNANIEPFISQIKLDDYKYKLIDSDDNLDHRVKMALKKTEMSINRSLQYQRIGKDMNHTNYHQLNATKSKYIVDDVNRK